MNSTSTNKPYNKRVAVVALLLFSCIVSSLLLWKTEPSKYELLSSPAQLDSLITLTFDEFLIPQSVVRMHMIQVDSLFSRNTYTVRVPRSFSKTSFHYHLHKELLPYTAKTIGLVEFPDRNLRIHVIINNKVHRSVFLNTDPLLENTHDL